MKVLPAVAASSPAMGRLRREVTILQHVSYDKNVVQFYGASLEHAADAMLVMECAFPANSPQSTACPAAAHFCMGLPPAQFDGPAPPQRAPPVRTGQRGRLEGDGEAVCSASPEHLTAHTR